MARQDVTLARLRYLIRPGGISAAPVPNPNVAGPVPAASGPSSVGRTVTPPIEVVGDTQIAPNGGSTNDPGPNSDNMVEISSPDQGKGGSPPQGESLKRAANQVASSSTWQRSDGAVRDFSPLDRSFDAFGFIASHLLVPKAQEVLKDFDPVESLRWVQWALLRSATVMKSVEPRLTMIDESERRNLKLVGDLKALNQEKIAAEAEKVEAVNAKGKAEEDLKSLEVELANLRKSKDEEIERLRGKEKDLGDEVKRLQGLVADEKAMADLAQSSQCDSLVEDAKGAVAATETTLKAQPRVLLPDFDSAQIGFFKDIIDGKVVDLPIPE
ncbi:hypothetical protein PIB30_016336 [Stylosanthes scabra]|uniref:Uncharacterized protein n=1 Tax=Stylosanthes scabra TaxID=79078 RepID=A0ABU6S7W6_9FABA|nr:hypothetical protein [Stylosanthes scabra]